MKSVCLLVILSALSFNALACGPDYSCGPREGNGFECPVYDDRSEEKNSRENDSDEDDKEGEEGEANGDNNVIVIVKNK